MENNPNIIDSLFVPENCVLYSSPIAQMIREKRQLFLHKGCWAKFKGYAYSQIHKMRTKQPTGKRMQIIEQFGFDVKFAYHVVRLLDEVEQILSTGQLNLQRNKEQLKAIRRGDWSLAQIEDYFREKEKQLESVFVSSKLPDYPDTDAIRELLTNCLEQHYGSIDTVVVRNDQSTRALKQIARILQSSGID